jgi:hypothetical protein
MKFSMELALLKRWYGTEVAALVAEEGIRSFSKEIHPNFANLVHAAQHTMLNNSDPREWIRIHCIGYLETKDPEDELFHAALGYAITNMASLEELVPTGA